MRMLSYTIQGRRIKKTFALHHEEEPQKKEDEGEQTPSVDWWFEDLCVLDTDYFVRTVAAIKEKGVRAELIGAIISHYAVKWLPGLTQQHTCTSFIKSKDEDMVEAQRKQRRMVDALVRILPKEEDAVSSSFVLRLLRIANMVGASDTYRRALEKRVGTQLHSATLSDLLIPSFSHTCDTLLDVDLVYRVITHFLHHKHTNSNADGGVGVDVDVDDDVDLEVAMVAKLLDGYLAEVALDPNLQLSAFERLADCLPSRARVCHDGLYRAIDTYLKAHVRLSEEERKRLCRLMDCFKLSPDACMHAAQNERLPDRTAIYVLFCEQLRGKTVKEEKDDCEMGSVAELKEEIEKMKDRMGKLEEMCMSMEMTEGGRRRKGTLAWGLNAWKWMSERRRMRSLDLDARPHPCSPPSKQH